VTKVTAYARRFGLVYFALAAVVGAAVGGTIVLAGRGGHSGSPWSEWRPTSSGELRTKEIANRVATAYRLANGRPLVDVVTGAPFQSVVTEIATPAIGAGFGRDTPLYDPSRTRMFVLCGGGKNCSLTGTPSVERTRLLRREALELALYTLKYVDTDAVVEFLPGVPKARPNLALFFRRHELEPFLSHPLRATVPQKPQRSTAREIDELTLSHMFRFTLQPAQTGGGLLVLDRG
jgi:hypothetical protein